MITEVRLRLVRLPLVHGFETSSHRKDHLDHVLVEIRDEAGGTGWGEIASGADPWYAADTTDTALLVSRRYLAPALVGARWETPDEAARTWARVRGHEFAKAGFDIAVRDLHARREGRPLAEALGGTRSVVEAGVSLGIEPTLDALAEQVGRHVAAGYRRVKLKIKPGWDVEPVRVVREAYPDVTLHVDANGAYPDDDASTAVMKGLDGLGLALIEQPYAPRDLLAHARLQQRADTAVCLDESIVDPADVDTALALRACRSINVKVSRMGGLGPAVAAHDKAFAAGIPVWCGGMHEFGIGRAANVALSALPNFTYPSDVSASEKYYARDVIVPPVTADAGTVAVPSGPGLGHDVDVEWIERNTVTTVRIDADGETGE